MYVTMHVRNSLCPRSFRMFGNKKQLKYVMNSKAASSCSWPQTSLTLWDQTLLPYSKDSLLYGAPVESSSCPSQTIPLYISRHLASRHRFSYSLTFVFSENIRKHFLFIPCVLHIPLTHFKCV